MTARNCSLHVKSTDGNLVEADLGSELVGSGSLPVVVTDEILLV